MGITTIVVFNCNCANNQIGVSESVGFNVHINSIIRHFGDEFFSQSLALVAVFYPDTLGLGGNRKNWGVAKFEVPKAPRGEVPKAPRSEAPKAPRGVGSGGAS